MFKVKSSKVSWVIMLTAFFVIIGYSFYVKNSGLKENKNVKLYWFIPDGLRAEDELFQIYDWAEKGELPHLKKLMQESSYGYSKPVFPSHTPTNFATLMTGQMPDVHGVADGTMRHIGYPLSVVLKGGFSSAAKRVPSLWNIFEDMGLNVTLLSIPGSTPPNLNFGNTIKGRWGGWGAEINPIIFHSEEDRLQKQKQVGKKHVFGFGSELTRFIQAGPTKNWEFSYQSYSETLEIDLSNWGYQLFAVVIDSTDDKKTNYDKLVLSLDKKIVLTTLSVSEWSNWLPITIQWEIKDPQNRYVPQKSDFEKYVSRVVIPTNLKIKVVRLGSSKSFRIRILYDSLNLYLLQPSSLYDQLSAALGPMVDYADSYPPQLIYTEEDKNTFLEEADMSFNWHKNASSFMFEKINTDVVFQSIYTPNQMLTSKWWLPFIDPSSPLYKTKSDSERQVLWQEVKNMYRKVDEIVGNIAKHADANTYIVFSSDHGAIPLYKEVYLNNLFASKGWLNFSFNSETEEYEIDWEKTKVVFLQMNNIYINPKGLAGNYLRSGGPEYEKLRNEVIQQISNLEDPEKKTKVTKNFWIWEDAKKIQLPQDRVGDIVVSNAAHYLFSEDITKDLKIFDLTDKGGYKQAVSPDTTGLRTPFLISGPGIKKNNRLDRIIEHKEQYHLLLHLLSKKSNLESKQIVSEILE